MTYLQPLWHWFQSQEKSRQISFVVGLLLIMVLTISLSIWAISPKYGVLFNNLDTEDANRIITQLEHANINYQVSHFGRDILIDQRLVDKTRIKLMDSDIALTHSVGFELFDKTDFGMTDFSQKINYQRALQGELERTIKSLDEVKQVRVHLVIPEQHLFQQNTNVPRAAVTLHLNRALTLAQIKSIQRLIATSVANLTAKNVMMVDSNGNGLTPSNDDVATSHFTAKKNLEHYLNNKIMQMINPIFPGQTIMVKIDATLNYDQLERERIKPQQAGLITHERETQHSSGNKTDKKAAIEEFSREKSYEFGREKERFTKANGTIERLTISVLLPENTPNHTIDQIERLVKSVAGFNDKRGDTMSIAALIAPSKPIHSKPIIAITRSSSGSLVLFYSGVMGLATLFFIGLATHYRHRLKKRQGLLNELNQWLLNHD